ncbi:hypothetical protein LCGC14_0929200 [marine sediment metagenome]|uniref:Uncharacterized protein n=1 Tax=marine sediment metagenome TaxID=412755 RepID=A0A0F9NNH3_9ZZZZ
MSFNDLLKDTAKINAFVSADEYNNITFSLGSSFPARFNPQEGKKVVTQNGEDAIIDGFLFFPASVSVNEKDQIEIDSVMYRIIAAKKQGDSGSDHHYKVAVRRL